MNKSNLMTFEQPEINWVIAVDGVSGDIFADFFEGHFFMANLTND